MLTILCREELDAVDLNWASAYIDEFGKPYFTLPAGREHYRLLAHLSMLYSHRLILDVGTFHGASAVALSTNPLVKVLSYDIQNHRTRTISRPNIEFRLRNVLDDPGCLAQASLILLDTFHDGGFERQFIRKLLEVGFRGTLLLDDIHLNEAMEAFWKELTLPKADLTRIGHWSGTGIAYFGLY
ncbi:MAG: hypothetical protein QM758_13130 [Armatimonas sp.]